MQSCLGYRLLRLKIFCGSSEFDKAGFLSPHCNAEEKGGVTIFEVICLGSHRKVLRK